MARYAWTASSPASVVHSPSRSLPDEAVDRAGSVLWAGGTSHSLMVLSSLPEAKVLPSGLKATDQTTACPLRVIRCLPVATSHSATVSSVLAEARTLPSGL